MKPGSLNHQQTQRKIIFLGFPTTRSWNSGEPSNVQKLKSASANKSVLWHCSYFNLAEHSFQGLHAELSSPSAAFLASTKVAVGFIAHRRNASRSLGHLFVSASAICSSVGTHLNPRHDCLSPAMSISTRFSAKLVLNLWIASHRERASVTGITSIIGVPHEPL